MKDETIEVRFLEASDRQLLLNVSEGVFDHSVRTDLADEFLTDPRHHIAAALHEGRVVGFVSGVHYLHPDKSAEMFINEAGVATAFQRRGLGKRLLAVMLAHAEELGCREAWVLTEEDNHPARGLYAAAGGKEERPKPVLFTFSLDDDRP